MIKIENIEVFNFGGAIRGMRNPMNSWDRSDSVYGTAYTLADGEKITTSEGFSVGKNDLDLMKRLYKGGPVHAKYLRQIMVSMDITAPLYWWKEFDTYKVGTTANSCSTMHKIHAKEFTPHDFSLEHLNPTGRELLRQICCELNFNRNVFIMSGDKNAWWQMIQLLPSSYNQLRTVQLNYEVLANMYRARKDHKLDEWKEFCKWVEQLPYSEIITGEEE